MNICRFLGQQLIHESGNYFPDNTELTRWETGDLILIHDNSWPELPQTIQHPL